MAVFGTFLYRDCTVYGTAGIGVADVTVLARDTVQLFLSSPVVINDAYGDKASYAVTRVDGNGILNVRAVLVPQDGTLTASDVVLHIDKVEVGVDYSIDVVGSILGVDGLTICSHGEFTGKSSKADSTLRDIPNHYDNKPGSAIRAMLQAVANADESIGGGS